MTTHTAHTKEAKHSDAYANDSRNAAIIEMDQALTELNKIVETLGTPPASPLGQSIKRVNESFRSVESLAK